MILVRDQPIQNKTNTILLDSAKFIISLCNVRYHFMRSVINISNGLNR